MKNPVRFVAILVALMTLSAKADDVGIFFPNRDFQWLPSLSLGVYYESNPHSIPKNQSGKKGEWGYRITPALGLAYEGKNSRLVGRVFYTWEDGQEKDQGANYWGESLSYSQSTEQGWRFMLSESYRRTNSNQFYGGTYGDTASIDVRKSETFSINGSIAKTSTSGKTTVSLGAGYSRVRYINDDDYLSGSETYNVQLQGNYRFSALTDFVGVATAGADTGQRMKSDSYQYTLMVGFASRLGLAKKITYRAVGGIGIYDYGGEYGSTTVAPSYSVSVAWAPTDKWAFSALANSQFTPSDSYQNVTYTWANAFTLGVNYKPWKKFDLRADASYRIEDQRTEHYAYSSLEYTRNYYAFRLRGSYTITRWFSIYAAASYTLDSYSGSGRGDVDEYRFDAGVQLKY